MEEEGREKITESGVWDTVVGASRSVENVAMDLMFMEGIIAQKGRGAVALQSLYGL
jgi:hypothetical protein